jgi:hypothetical protein
MVQACRVVEGLVFPTVWPARDERRERQQDGPSDHPDAEAIRERACMPLVMA